MIICSCGGLQHGLLETDPAFALEELDPEKKAKGNRCILWSQSELGRRTGWKTGCGEEENRFVPSIESGSVQGGGTGFSWALEEYEGRKGGLLQNI